MTQHSVPIGAVAALYDLAPSTLRWWERQGVMAPPGRATARRRYDELDLRRVGMAYLCHVQGRMPLASVAVVTSEKANFSVWQQVIKDCISHLDNEIEQMAAARNYLRNLLSCTDDDPASCPMLDPELRRSTPRGRIAATDLIEAADAATRRTVRPRKRDEKIPSTQGRDENAGVARECRVCGTEVELSPRGRLRTYCSRACQQHAYRQRRRGDNV
ncbi:MerR family transcriptional regulator [Amycolatopsis sp. A1MSW2902]|uniref:MerR family transcriptional regulator n=1 Tax=Amycolatopsis sp. A1MSW2902 TaxID=687413 RepID=UPI00307CD8A9